MQNIRSMIKRKLSLHDKNPNLDVDPEDVDEETMGHLHRDVSTGMGEKGDEHPYGKPGSFLNRLIMHGNRKTEDEVNNIPAKETQPTVSQPATQQPTVIQPATTQPAAATK